MDADGHVNKHGKIEITLKANRLSDDFGELLSLWESNGIVMRNGIGTKVSYADRIIDFIFQLIVTSRALD